MGSQAGWYAQPEGEMSYWDGHQWTHRWVPGRSVPWKDNEASSGPSAEQPSGSAMAQPMMNEPPRPPDPEGEPPSVRREKAVFWSPRVWAPIAAVVLALGLVGAYEVSQRASQSGSDATSSAADPAVQAAACARVTTLDSQIQDNRAELRAVPIDMNPNNPRIRQDLDKQWVTLNAERTAQDTVCKG